MSTTLLATKPNLDALKALARIARGNDTTPLSAFMLVRASPDGISAMVTNGAMTLSRSLMGSNKEPTTFTLPAQKFAAIAGALPGDGEISARIVDSRVELRCGKSRFHLVSPPVSDFPVPEVVGAGHTVTVLAEELRTAIESVVPAIGRGDFRMLLNGMLFEVGEGRLTLVATNGHRMHLASLPLPDKTGACQAILPPNAVTEVLGLCSDDATIEIGFHLNHMQFTCGADYLLSNLIDGRFPDYRKVIPKHEASAQIDVPVLRRALDRIKIFASDTRGAQLALDGKGKLRLSITGEYGNDGAEDSIPAAHSIPLTTGLNPAYLSDAISPKWADGAVLLYGSPSDAIVIGLAGWKHQFSAVIMPMRM